MNKAQNRPTLHKVLSMILALVMVLSLLPLSGFTASSNAAVEDYEYNIMFLDCGRKYFSVSSIKSFIDEASAAGFNYIQLAVGNDGMRFLLDDMSLTVNGTTYSSEEVSAAIHSGNEAYYDFNTDELTQSEMDTIIAYANEKGMGVIPCINTPGHMDAILDAAEALTNETCSYNGSTRTIDVTNSTAVSFTKAFLQKYINYFASKGCTLFNMGADEYANDIYTSGSMGFGNLQSEGKYSYYVTYVNEVAAMIKTAGMKPMAFNDGIYFNSKTSYGAFDTDILICYWSSGWGSYNPMPATTLASMGYKLINTHGDYYWVLGKSDSQCDANKAAGFDYKSFQGSTVENPAGSMFCIWCDYPGAGTESSVISNTSATIAAFGGKLPKVEAFNAVMSSTVYNSSGSTTSSESDVLSVTASGLTSLTCTQTTAPAINDAEADRIQAYDVTPKTADGNYTGSASVSIKIPSGWDISKVRGFVVNDNTVTSYTGTVSNDFYTFTAPHFSVMGLYQLAAASYTDTKEIELTVGGTVTVTQSNVESSGNITVSDSSIATVNAEYKNIESSTTRVLSSQITSFTTNGTTGVISDGNRNYLVIDSSGSISNTTDINDATEFTVKKSSGGGGSSSSNYTICDDNGYYLRYGSGSLSASKSSSKWYYNDGFAAGRNKNNNSYYYYYYIDFSDGKWTVSYSNSSSTAGLYGTTTKTTEPVQGTEITFTGVAAGTTEIQVGDVLYKITVTDKAPNDAMTSNSITLEHWITNAKVTSTSQGSTYTTTIYSSDASSDDGLAISSKSYNPGYWGTVEVYYWQAVCLDSDNLQTDDGGDDETADGTTLTHIRYHGDAWQYKTAADGTWHYFLSDDQLVAYYLQKTDVTQEITTYTKDYGYDTSSSTITNGGDGKGSVALSFAVVYPDGNISPVESSIYASSTMIFNYWDGRDIGIVAPENNSDYNIARITVTDGKRNRASDDSYWGSNDNWYGTSATSSDSITWEKTTDSSTGKIWYDETVVWDKVTDAGTTPMVNGQVDNITWSAKNTAKLVLIYLEPIEKETNLNVVWYDDNARTEISRTQVAMKYNQGDAEPTFTDKLMCNGAVIGGNGPWTGKTSTDSNYLPDGACVENSSGINQTFNKNLLTNISVTGVYASGLYEYVSAEISDDGKTLTLHYNLKATSGKIFVVDFGLPVNIPFADFGLESAATISSVSFDSNDITQTIKQGTYGTGAIDMTNKVVTYTLTKTLDSQVVIPIYVTFNDRNTIRQQVYIIPASTVYYEDSFATFTDGSYNSQDVKWDTVTDDTTQENVTQALEALGSKQNVYGYDPAYNSSTKYSLGSAHKVTVSSTMAEDENVVWPSATFTFTGTGFDIISLTDNTSGAIYVDVYQGSEATGTPVKRLVVNNYYGYKYENNNWIVSNEAGANPLYQIPVMKVDLTTSGTYTAVITVAYASRQDKTGGSEYTFVLDAIRVYNPIGKDYDYGNDGEKSPSYVEIKKVLLDISALSKENATGAVFIDGKGSNVTATEYANYGPNHEAYLANSQAIAFQLVASAEPTSVQLGAKLANGTAGSLTISGASCVKETEGVLSLNTSTDMYYELMGLEWSEQNDGTYKSSVITLTNNGKEGSIISLTNLKFIGATYTSESADVENATSEVALLSLAASPAMVDEAVLAVSNVLYDDPEPTPDPEPEVKTFEPDTFKVSLSKNSISAGQKATLTVKASAEVTAITVNGETYDSYKTRYERSGWNWRSAKTEYHVFTVSLTPTETTEYDVVAVNADGAVSETETVTLTVKAAQSNWWDNVWNNFFGKWF